MTHVLILLAYTNIPVKIYDGENNNDCGDGNDSDGDEVDMIMLTTVMMIIKWVLYNGDGAVARVLLVIWD